MDNDIVQQFVNSEFGTLRVVTDDENEPWFVASDIAKALGYRDAEKMTRRLDDDEKGTRLVGTPGGEQQMTVITEAGMYSAILGSKVEGAKRFKRWVTHDVLPAIRRDGGYLGKSGSNKNVPLQRYVEQGLFRIKETAITHADGHVSINRTTKVTGKGQRYFIDRYCKVQKLA